MIRNALFIFGICATIFIVFLPSYLQMQELHGKNQTYERQIRDLTQENEALLAEKRRLEEDPAYFERYAREKFGIIKDGEVIYKIVPAGTAGTTGMSPTVNAQVPKGPETSGVAKKAAKSMATAKSGTAKGSSKKGLAGSATRKRAVKTTGSGSKDHTDPSNDKSSE